MKKSKWLWYTVIVGMIPLIIRSLLYIFSTKTISFFNAPDLIFFGIILSITNINELEYVNIKRDNPKGKTWKTRTNVLSIVLVIIYSSFLIFTGVNEMTQNLFNISAITYSALLLNFVNFLFSLSIYRMINSIESHQKT